MPRKAVVSTNLPSTTSARFLDETAFDALRLDEHDCYSVAGAGSKFKLLNWATLELTPEEDDPDVYRRIAAERDYLLCGAVGVAADGSTVVHLRRQTSEAKREAAEVTLRAAAAFVAQMEAATERRRKTGSVVDWLNALAALEDPR